MDTKKVKLKISRKKLEQMSKEEVFQFIESEREKYKEEREEAKRRKREELGHTGPTISERLAAGGWMVIVPLGLGAGILIVAVALILSSFFAEDYVIQTPSPEPFSISLSELAVISSDGIEIQRAWQQNDFTEVVASIDAFTTNYEVPDNILVQLYLKRLQALYFSEAYQTTISYSQTLQSRYRENNSFQYDVLWLRAHAQLSAEQYFPAFQTFRHISQQPGSRAEEAYQNARHIQAEFLL